MLFEGLCEDENVVQIDYDHAFRDKVLKDVVHHRLEGGGTVCKAEEHDQGFEQAASNFVKYFAPRSFAISSGISGSGYLFFTVMAFSAR